MTRITETTVGTFPVRDFLRPAAAIGYWDPLRAAADTLLNSEADAVLVRHDSGELAGLISERDLVLGAQAEAFGAPAHAGEYASEAYVRAQETESLEAVLRRMALRSVHRAVVLDRSGEPAGVLSVRMGIPSQSVGRDARSRAARRAARLATIRRDQRSQAVDLSSDHSFPASDPPGWIA